MKTYNISDVAKKFHLSKSTIRYYDQENLIAGLKRDTNGTRIFTNTSLTSIHTIECLKKTGMPIREIQQYFNLIQQGDSTLEDRLSLFTERKATVKLRIEELEQVLNEIDWKCHYYSQAIADGTEQYVKETAETNQSF
ncbi:MerR family transcriptional regulator [Lactiplantibacillus paraplantarum]|uniref:MerR family transcriptional regulator n=1 Tax=Lactiplantibacillus paraplantarum TaxID=60520 RepID=A0AAD0TM97_9LACO|nr:MerR family transcriptional regulator [Lactiplantibacillus paraplantarum]AVW09395.1 MerR family transcriptional regulator [Lactiplantibacillus paraplantarum]AYJ37662.1 MerR family transcriptional regulator [Lactiplantibacillus paraplantarum]ERL43648.1 MerR family transcriptional regulator [Lactiplantibacillus paraplantarum]KRL50944.1 hypothetical protein FD48_GL001993 [Lactiplantibacillus paraplantarum DSM 10667]MCU4682613.1 MerR family transcriptional regulator [Lactiplantibacillus parapla